MVNDLIALARATPWWTSVTMIAAVVIKAHYQGKTARQGIMATRMILESPNRPAAMRVSFGQYRGASLDVTDQRGAVADDELDVSSDEGFATFYRDTYPWIVQRVRAYFAGTDMEAVHDAVNDAYLACRMKLPELRSDDPRAQRRYVLTAAVNNVRRQHRQHHDWDPLADLDGRVEDHAPDVADKLTVLNSLARLPERQRQALIASAYLDLSVEQIAAQMGISPSTVRTHLDRARRAVSDDLRGRAA
jgi:RNA polymerase sigma-70 factor, ECF subfamily